MRITDNMRFNTNVSNLFNIQSRYNDLMEKIATQKKVNRASDDPIAAAKIVDIRQGMAANEQYRKNIADSDNWVSITESTLSSAYKLLTKARGIALGEAEGTADAASRKIAAQNIQSFIDEMASLANEKIGDRYIFSGSKNSAAPFSTTPGEARIEAVEQAGNNVFNGTVLSSADYSGPVKTFTVKITTGGSLDTATAQISTDGGATWSGTDLAMASGEINLGDGISLDLGTGTFAVNDTFIVDATAGNVAVTPDIGNTFTGTVTTSVGYSGALNKTYAVKITGNKDSQGTTTPGVSTAQISTDGGRTWELANLPADGEINLGDNVKLTIENAATETFGENDIFIVNAAAGGYYQGNSDELSMAINRGISIAYNITGAEAFTASAGGGVDIFRTLNDLQIALENNDTDGISGQLENLKNAQEQVLLNQSLCGTKANHLEMAKNSLTNLDEKLTSLLSAAQDADLAEFATRLSLQEIALQASYAMAAKIGDTTILKFLT
jgi:flagellar hook-associated protein 3 FlgL